MNHARLYRTCPRAALAAGALMGFVLAAEASRATLYTIVTTADGVANDGNCTLREAIRASEQNAAVDQCAAGGTSDTIVLAAPTGSYVFTQGQEVISAAGSELVIRGDLSLPASSHVIDLQDANRFLQVYNDVRVTLENLWLLSGRAPAGSDYGGALLVNDSELTLRDVALYTSSAHSGGALYFNNTSASGRLRLERVTFEFNLARDGSAPGEPEGGAAWVGMNDGVAELVDVTFRGNEATSSNPNQGVAGALRVVLGGPGRATLRRVDFVSNQARRFGALHLLPQFGSENGAVALLEDVTFRQNSISAALGSNAAAFMVEIRGTSQLVARRILVSDNLSSSTVAVEAIVSASEAASIRIDNAMVVNGDGRGLLLAAADEATVLAGHLTVSGHQSTGLGLAALGSGMVRLESSILWNNGLVAPDDLDTFGTTPSVDPTANRNLIGEQGSPSPLFVDPVNGDYELQEASPARDAGDGSFASARPFDLLHRPRIVGPAPDLGALERGGIFGDDFEVGDSGAWSARQP